eukprot:TRINITY_DN112524_c0_g1_i1.p1 TRINITY_DN112524_c0_g1~~TRINITY_DN112524_c0_g1_i1.p1  ORF type:complete len:508 (-),score=107.44 TRINITY_DN112524_c0_g1_i1:92-1558(-)
MSSSGGYGRMQRPPPVTAARIESFKAPPRPNSQAGVCGIGDSIVASLTCGGSLSCRRDEAPEIDIDGLDHPYGGVPPPEFEGGYDVSGANHTGIYSASKHPLVGDVLLRGQVWMLTEAAGCADRLERGELRLYPNGVSFHAEGKWGGSSSSSAQPTEAILEPFAFVRPVQKQSAALQEAIAPLPSAKMFAITLYLKSKTLFFGVSGRNETKAQDSCMQWVRYIALCMRWVTESLFARGSCFQAAPGPPAARGGFGCDRLMAGYLLQSENSGEFVRIVFVELHPPRDAKACLLLYDDSACSTEPCQEVTIDARTPCYEKVGHDCSCFCVGHLHLSARTVFERQIWLRSVANLKVKLQSRGPDPRSEELSIWREAINDHIRENAKKLRNQVCMSSTGTRPGLADEYYRNRDSLDDNSPVLRGSEDTVDKEMDILEAAEQLRGMPLLRQCSVDAITKHGAFDAGTEMWSSSMRAAGSTPVQTSSSFAAPGL